MGRHVTNRGAGIRVLLVAFTAMPFALVAQCRQDAHAGQADANTAPPASNTSQQPAAVLILPGRLQAWHDTPIYARLKGYVKQWYVDFGASVKAGQLLAEIDTPDLDANLEAAEAKLSAAIAVLFVTAFFVSFSATYSTDRAEAQSNQALHIDIPVKLEKANVVLDIGHMVLNGDMPFFLGDMDLLATDLKDWNVKGEVIAVFHGDAAYILLNDESL